MYRLVFILALSLAAITPARAAPEPSLRGDAAQKEYQKLLENYYFLDKQKAGHITCSVSASNLQDFLDNLNHTAGKDFSIVENLHDFSVTYDRIKGFSFNSPRLNVSLLPDMDMANPEQLEAWINATEGSFRDRENNMERFIALFLKDMTSPGPETRNNLSLAKNGDAMTVAYDINIKRHDTIEYAGATKTQKISETSPAADVTYKSDYLPLGNGKLALAHRTDEIINSFGTTDSSYTVSYQDLGSAFFPAQISSIGTKDDPGKKRYDIDFKDCKTSDVSQ